MYIIGCRAHFCHLPGLDLVGHSPEGTQWECWDPGLGPNVVRLPVHLPPLCPLPPLSSTNAPWCPTPLLALNAPDTPNPCWPWAPTPLPAPMPLTPLPASQFPLTPPTSLLASWVPILSYWPLTSPDAPTPCQLQCPNPNQTLNAPWCPLHPLLAPDTPTPRREI